MAATEIQVMITESGNFFCALRGNHRQLYKNILCSRVELLFCVLVGLAVCLFCVYELFSSTVSLFTVA